MWVGKDIKGLLERLEWCGTADFQLYTVPRCPICGGLAEDTKINELQMVKAGHKPECELKKAIDEFRDETICVNFDSSDMGNIKSLLKRGGGDDIHEWMQNLVYRELRESGYFVV